MKFMDEVLRFRNRLAPQNNELREVEVIDSWTVRWESRHGEFSGQTRPEVEVFAGRELAEEFADALRLAFKLIRHTSQIRVTVTRSDA